MCSRFPRFVVSVLACCQLGCVAGGRRELRVCADPKNLPFSNRAGAGFENRIASLIARELDAEVSYTWWAQRRGFVRNTLNEKRCDIVMGVPASYELLRTTRPYYRSTYVFLTRADRNLDIQTLDDPRLRELRIGIQVVGEDGAATPPAQALANRGIINNVKGYSVYGDYSQPNPPARIVAAVAQGEVDIAVVWGPLAGYFARRQSVPLKLQPVTPQIEPPFLPMVFDISMGVRRADSLFHRKLNELLVSRRREIDAILDEYGVPRVRAPGRRTSE
jgi:mxaJ protein